MTSRQTHHGCQCLPDRNRVCLFVGSEVQTDHNGIKDSSIDKNTSVREKSKNHLVCLLVVHTAAASSPSGWTEHGLCSRSRRQRSSWAGRSVPCTSSTSPGAGSLTIPTCWCLRVQCRCTWTVDVPAGCGCCIGPSWCWLEIIPRAGREKHEEEETL